MTRKPSVAPTSTVIARTWRFRDEAGEGDWGSVRSGECGSSGRQVGDRLRRLGDMVANATIAWHPMLVRTRQKQDPQAEQQEVEQLRALVQQFVRRFGLLVARRTPCGFPVSSSYAHALMLLLRRSREGHTTLQSDLAGTLAIDKSNIARLCERMVKAGHGVQTVPLEDGR